MKKHTVSRLLNSVVLMALLLSTLPAATPALSQSPAAIPAPPQALPSPGGALRLAPPASAPGPQAQEKVEVISAASPATPQAPNTCGAPAKIPFGQDLELLMGPMWNNVSTRIDQAPAWGSTAYAARQPGDSDTHTGTHQSGSCNVTPDQAAIFRDDNYDGDCTILPFGQYPDPDHFGISGVSVSSIKVGKNVRVTIYEDVNFGGRSYTTADSISDLKNAFVGTWDFNDHTHSIKVSAYPRAVGNVAAAAWGTDRNLVLMKTYTDTNSNGELAHVGWDAAVGWGGMPDRRGITADGNPVVVARGLDMSYFVRSGTRISFAVSNNGTWSPWADLPGVTDAASDPAVVSADVYHMKLFYRTSAGAVKFTEWESSAGWRTTPLNLGSPSGTTIASDLSAVARDENHVAVFGVSANNTLWVKEWSNANQSDWSDTAWVNVMSGVNTVKPAAASRFSTQMGVVVLTTANLLSYKEWTYQQYAANLGTPRGWKDSVNLNAYFSPPGLIATSTDEMFTYGVDNAGGLWSKRWTKAGGWEGSVSRGSGWATGQAVAAVAARPHNLMLVGRDTNNNVVFERYTNQDQALASTTLANPTYGVLRGQAVATVNGRTVWVSAWRGSEGKWIMAARDTATGVGTWMFLDDPVPSTGTNNVSLAVADLDRDGNDEIILATLNGDARMNVSVYGLTMTGSSVTAIGLRSSTSYNSSSPLSDVNVAVGDLDGDGKRAEVAVGIVRQAYTQEVVKVYRYSSGSLSYLSTIWADGVDTTTDTDGPIRSSTRIQDFEMAIGQVDSQVGEQIVLMTYNGNSTWYPYIVTFRFDPATTTFSQVYATSGSMSATGAVGAYSTALGTGDMDSDGIDEVIYTYGPYIGILRLPGNMSIDATLAMVGSTDANRSLAVGDVDGDGRAEIVYSTDSGLGASGGWMGILKKVHPWSAGLTWFGSKSVRGVPLLADLDGDSGVATFKRCDEVSDVHVLGVVNSQPVWYQNGASVQNSGGGTANSQTATTGQEDGWTASFGIAQEVEVGLSIDVLTIKATRNLEVAGSVGGSTSREKSTTTTSGVAFGSQAFGQGAVCYAKTSYQCYSYEVSTAGSTITTTAMSCVPAPTTGVAGQECSSLEYWQSAELRNAAGPSWAPVGHRPPNTTTVSVDLGWTNNYPVNLTAPPVDPFRLLWSRFDPFNVHGDPNPNSTTQNWSIEDASSTTRTKTGSFEVNLTIGAGLEVLGNSVMDSVSVGYGHEWSSSVGWEEGIEFNGAIYHYPSICPAALCKPYSIVPYVYMAKAKTMAGVTYPYIEQDYYVSHFGMADQAIAEAAPHSIVGLTPQAPVVTSTTHPNPATWYPTNTVVLSWGQPAGDPAVVIGYKWNLDTSPVVTPTSMSQLTTTHTYQGMADGIYYLHIQAMGDGSDQSPITHRAVRVDTGAPQVKFVASPFVPDGFAGWYNTPVTVSVTATDTTGSGVASVETSPDGTTWQPYSAPLPITANTPGVTLWARAADSLGHTSDLISTTLKLDKTPPRTVDSDGFGLSYASILTDEVGNAQLVLGGALSDTLSGRLQVELKAGDTGQWNAVSAVGDLPVPPGNEFSTTMTSLNWIYTPTFEIRGVYPLWGRGVDQAGNYETAWIHGAFWWEPDDVPVLAESRVSVSPRQAYPGDMLAFTVAARNSGYQEAQLLITDTVPAGLTVLPDSIGDGGQYDAGARVITWTLHALWPGQTHYLFFKATADSVTTPVTLENRLDLMAYWPWDNLPGVPAEPARHYYSTSTTLTVLPRASGLVGAASLSNSTAPRVLDAAVVEGEIVNDPQVTLLVNASPETRQLYVKEWTWDASLNAWNLARESGWVPFEAAAGFEVSQDASGKYGRYQWTLSQGDGVKYLGIWVADAAGQVSNLNEGNLIYTNLVSAGGQQLAAGQRVQYRVSLRASQLAVLSLVSLSGDADLYVWKPRAGFKPNYYSNAAPSTSSLSIDTVGFFAEEEGVYVVEVQAVTDAYYRLVTAGDLSGAGLLAQTQVNPALARLTEGDLAALKAQDEVLRDARQTLPPSTHLALADKDRPAHPLNLSTPYGRSDVDTLPTAPQGPTVYLIYLPLVGK